MSLLDFENNDSVIDSGLENIVDRKRKARGGEPTLDYTAYLKNYMRELQLHPELYSKEFEAAEELILRLKYFV